MEAALLKDPDEAFASARAFLHATSVILLTRRLGPDSQTARCSLMYAGLAQVMLSPTKERL
jgi:hypothetical protein